MSEVRNLRASEEGSCSVRTSSNTGTAADAGGGVHGEIGIDLLNRCGVGFRSASRRSGDESSGGNDAIERTTVYSEILDDGKCLRTPRFEKELVSILEVAHVKLTDSCAREAAVCFSVHHEAAHTADALAAIMIE